MLRKMTVFALSCTLATAAMIYLVGCHNQPPLASAVKSEPKTESSEPERTPTQAKKAQDHAHKPGAHQGIIIEIGRDNYHAEAVFEQGGAVKLFTLGKDEAQVIDVEKQELTAYVKEEGSNDSQELLFHPVPRPGDNKDRTSQFVSNLPGELVGKQLFITIPSITINNERFRVGFASVIPRHDEGMPIGVSDIDEKDLYAKPGGIYTEADIKANGNVPAALKYKGLTSRHDAKPAVGDKICPISRTKANPKFTWVVSGKTYAFCCPPCVDEFVSWAKTQPELIRAPEEYVKKK